MILEARTKRKNVRLASVDTLYSNSALSVTIELPCQVYEGKSYHITMTEENLKKYLAVIEERKRQIAKINLTAN